MHQIDFALIHSSTQQFQQQQPQRRRPQNSLSFSLIITNKTDFFFFAFSLLGYIYIFDNIYIKRVIYAFCSCCNPLTTLLLSLVCYAQNKKIVVISFLSGWRRRFLGPRMVGGSVLGAAQGGDFGKFTLKTATLRANS